MSTADSDCRAVFFDLDETLIDAGKCHVEAGVRTFDHYGMDYVKAQIGRAHV